MARTLPSGFESEILSYGWLGAARLLDAMRTTEPSLSLRANPAKGARIARGGEAVPWEPLGCYLAERPVFAADPAWHQGRYYVQDASSMAVGQAVRTIVERYFSDRADLRYLDACAAPGGKTIAAIDALPQGSYVVANEADRHRANILAENIAKRGAAAVAVTRGNAQRFGRLPETFDIIAADVPCSGEGMMRKDAEAIDQWSPELVADCASLQFDIVRELWRALKRGGVLIYSTCTFNRSENEENVTRIAEEFGAESVDLGLDSFEGVQPGLATPLHCYRFAPGFVHGEGLFIAALSKPGELSAKSKNIKNNKRKKGETDVFAAKYLIDSESFTIFERAEVEAVPSAHAEVARTIAEKLDAIRVGLPIAVQKGRELIPTHELAISTALGPGAMPMFELDYNQTMAYLRGEAITNLPDDLPRGYALPSFGGYPLGLVKNIGRRANNLYPSPLRLRLDPKTLKPIQLPLEL